MADEAAKTNNKAEKVSVTMTDGRVVEFNKKQKLVKSTTVADNGDISALFDFANGQTRSLTVPTSHPLYARYTAHGIEQKHGDAIAGESDIEDAVAAFDDVFNRAQNGEWTAQRAGGSFAGTSILMKALMEASGKSREDIQAYLSTKSMQEKHALRRSDKLKPIIDRLEAEKAAGSTSSVDTDALLGELGLASAPAKGKAAKQTEPA